MTNKIDEGYIKFNCEWKNKPLQINVPEELLKIRDELHLLKLIGQLKKVNVSYGNISIKTSKGILISGTQIGHVFPITQNEFTLVTNIDVAQNKVVCVGPIKASSETLTHAAIYNANKNIKAVIHIHNKKMWLNLLNKIPTTAANVSYGTPKMASEIKRLLTENLSHQKINMIAMAGHEDGIISFGKNLQQAFKTILAYKMVLTIFLVLIF